MSKVEIDTLIKEQILCRIVFGGKISPYIAQFQYVFLNGHMYFHFTEYGKKMDFLYEDVPVCVEVEKYVSDLSTYNFGFTWKTSESY